MRPWSYRQVYVQRWTGTHHCASAQKRAAQRRWNNRTSSLSLSPLGQIPGGPKEDGHGAGVEALDEGLMEISNGQHFVR